MSQNQNDAKNRNYKRRCYVINAAFQWKYTLTLALGVFLVASAMGMTLFGFLHEQARQRVLHPEAMNVWENTQAIFLFALAFSGIVVLTLLCWGIMITHRVSGPIFVLDRGLRTLTAGRLPDRRPLRKRDEFKELYETFWVYVDSLVSRRRSDSERLAEILSAVRDSAGNEAAVLESVAKQVAELRNDIAESIGEGVNEEQDQPAPEEEATASEQPLELAGSAS